MSFDYWLMGLLCTVVGGVIVYILTQVFPAKAKNWWQRFFVRYEIVMDDCGDGYNAPDHSDDHEDGAVPCYGVIPRLNTMGCFLVFAGFLFTLFLAFVLIIIVIALRK